MLPCRSTLLTVWLACGDYLVILTLWSKARYTMRFSISIHSPQRIVLDYFGDPSVIQHHHQALHNYGPQRIILTLVPPSGQHFHLNKKSKKQNGIKFTEHSCSWEDPPWTRQGFPLTTPSGQNICTQDFSKSRQYLKDKYGFNNTMGFSLIVLFNFWAGHMSWSHTDSLLFFSNCTCHWYAISLSMFHHITVCRVDCLPLTAAMLILHHLQNKMVLISDVLLIVFCSLLTLNSFPLSIHNKIRYAFIYPQRTNCVAAAQGQKYIRT